MYRAVDIYLKAHPWLTDLDRELLCRLMDCQKLSLEASTHAAQNERLPLRFIVQVLFFEQLRLRTSVAGCLYVSDNYNSQTHLSRSMVVPESGNMHLYFGNMIFVSPVTTLASLLAINQRYVGLNGLMMIINYWFGISMLQHVLKLTEHTAAVMAITCSPHQSNLLVSGGGTADRCIRFWNTVMGTN